MVPVATIFSVNAQLEACEVIVFIAILLLGTISLWPYAGWDTFIIHDFIRLSSELWITKTTLLRVVL